MLLYLFFKLHCCILTEKSLCKQPVYRIEVGFVIFHVSSEYKCLHLKPTFSTREVNSRNTYSEVEGIKPPQNLKSAQFQVTVDGSI